MARRTRCVHGVRCHFVGAEPSSATEAPISASSVVLLYVKHPIKASGHDEALSRTLLSGGLGAALVF
jgi:hypothetical protein